MPGRLQARLQREYFDPTWLGPFVNPFCLARTGLRDSIARYGSQLQGRVLDVGCGTKPYRRFVKAAEYVGLEFDTPANRSKPADIFYSGGQFPVDAESFDGVLATEVLEHVFEPAVFLAEVRRVLRPGGLLLMTVPFVWDEHEQPYDYGRYTSFGVRHLLEKAAFNVLALEQSCTGVRALTQLVAADLYKRLPRSHHVVREAIKTALFMAPVTLTGICLSMVLPDNNDFYLDNVALARRQ